MVDNANGEPYKNENTELSSEAFLCWLHGVSDKSRAVKCAENLRLKAEKMWSYLHK